MNVFTNESMRGRLVRHRIAILLTDGFEEVEMTKPRDLFEDEGATCTLVAPGDEVQGFHHLDKADLFEVDLRLDKAREEDFDALLLPGGVLSPDQLRIIPAFAREAVAVFAERQATAAGASAAERSDARLFSR